MNTNVIQVRSEDGVVNKAVSAFPDARPPFPGILLVHGGMGELPEQELLDIVTEDSLNGKHLVEAGYAVLASDYRHPSHADGEVLDTVAAYQALCDNELVDETRTGMVGTSHGAVCVLHPEAVL